MTDSAEWSIERATDPSATRSPTRLKVATCGQVAKYIQYLLRCWQSSPSDESSIIRSTKSRSLWRSFSRENASAIIGNYLLAMHVTTSTRIVDELADVNAVWRTTVVCMRNDPRSPCHRTSRSIVVYILYKHVFNKHGEKSNRWILCLSLPQLERRPLKVTQTDRWSVVGIIDPS